MDTNILNMIKSALPMIGTALGGPLAGTAIQFLVDKTGIAKENVESALSDALSSKDKLDALKQIESSFKLHMAELGYNSVKDLEEINASIIKEVNTTMRTEINSEHWASYTWRPFIGMSFGMYVNSLWILPLFKIAPVALSDNIVMAIGGILGVASYFRGKAQADPLVQTPTTPTSKG